MELVLFAILLFVCFLSLIEDRLQKYNRIIYITLTVVLILFAGLREVGFDRDSENYEYFFINYDDPILELVVEFSYRILSRIFHLLTDDVHSIFIFYAIVGVTFKMVALRRLSKFWFLPVTVYLAHYYCLHDLTQIRVSIASGCVLFSIPLIEQRKRKEVFYLFVLGFIFHYSALVLLPVIFLSGKDMNIKERWMWASLIPLGYLAYFIQFSIISYFNIPYITDKIEAYENIRDKGLLDDEINVFNYVFLLKCIVFLFSLYFYDTIKQNERYLPLILKFMGFSIFSYLFFAQIPTLSFRISELFGIADILMFTYICYMVRPLWLGKCVVIIISIMLSVYYIFIDRIFESV